MNQQTNKKQIDFIQFIISVAAQSICRATSNSI